METPASAGFYVSARNLLDTTYTDTKAFVNSNIFEPTTKIFKDNVISAESRIGNAIRFALPPQSCMAATVITGVLAADALHNHDKLSDLAKMRNISTAVAAIGLAYVYNGGLASELAKEVATVTCVVGLGKFGLESWQAFRKENPTSLKEHVFSTVEVLGKLAVTGYGTQKLIESSASFGFFR